MNNELDFGKALDLLGRGAKLSRTSWNGKGMFIALQSPDENSKMGLPYIYFSTVDGTLVPWSPSNTDLLAVDWFVHEATPEAATETTTEATTDSVEEVKKEE